MDKKKVKELIKQVIEINVNNFVYGNNAYNAPLNKANTLLSEAIKELSKSDWVSVEDSLPPYEEDVYVVDKNLPNGTWVTCRTENGRSERDKNNFSCPTGWKITHWKPLEKFEE